MKTRPYLQQRPDAAVDLNPARCRPCDPRQDLEQRALARSIPSDHADHFSTPDLEADIVQGPDASVAAVRPAPGASQRRTDVPERRVDRVRQCVTQRPVGLTVPDTVALAEMINAYRDIAHEYDHEDLYDIRNIAALRPSHRMTDITHRLSHQVGERVFHSREIVQAGDEGQGHDRDRHGKERPRSIGLAEHRPAKALHDAGHGIQAVDSAP